VQETVEDNLEHIVSFFDEPFADPSLVPTYFVSQLARKKVTVAIAGDGGDEVFAGYEKYSVDHVENKLREKIPNIIRKSVFPTLSKLSAQVNINLFQRASSLLNSLSKEPAMGFYISNSFIKDQTWLDLASEETKTKLGAYHPSQHTIDFYNKGDGKDHLSRILYTDMKTYLPGDILVKVDRMSMANSLEVRAPLLDKDIIEFSATLPSSLKFNQGEKKYILKETFKPVLPHDILYRKKMGFSVPLATWLRGELKDITADYLFTKSSGIQQFFNMQVVEELWQQHQQSKADHSTVLWSMLMFQMWWFKYLQNESPKDVI
jgi:asparagine synthase (glutamine-hydrolysing)